MEAQSSLSCRLLPQSPGPSPAGAGVFSNLPDAHPMPRLNAGVAGEQTRLSAPPAPHSARLVCPKSLPLNLPLSAPCSPRE